MGTHLVYWFGFTKNRGLSPIVLSEKVMRFFICTALIFVFCNAHGLEKSSPCSNVEVSQQVYECAKFKYRESDDELNNVYRDIIEFSYSSYGKSNKELASKYVEKIKNSQRAWLKYRDASCEVVAFVAEEQSLANSVARLSCMTEITNKRVVELRAWKSM